MKFTIYQGTAVDGDKAGLWYWRLKSGNGEIVADGSEGYAERGGAFKAIKRVQRGIPKAKIDG